MMEKDSYSKNPRILAAAMITSFMTTFMSSALNLSVPSLESYFGVNAAYVSWIVSSYTIAVAAMSLPMGKVSDITSRRTVFLTGIAGFGILSAVSIFAPSIGVLMFLRALSGTCAAMIFATNNSILISAFPHTKRLHIQVLQQALSQAVCLTARSDGDRSLPYRPSFPPLLSSRPSGLSRRIHRLRMYPGRILPVLFYTSLLLL